MKKMILFTLLFSISLISSANVSEVYSASTIIESKIPQKVLSEFYSSFIIIIEGKFRGAYIGNIKSHASMHEIVSLIKNRSFSTLDETKIYEGYKPKGKRGCKKRKNWICTLEGTVADI